MKNNNTSLVFIHYFGGNANSWNWLAKRLEHKYNCVFLDLPGFGKTKPLEELSVRSFAEWISAEIKSLDLKDYILIGHSMGGKLALFTSFVSHDLLPKKLILIAPSPPTKEKMSDDEKQRMLNHPDKSEAIVTVRNAARKKLKKGRFKLAVNSQLDVDPATWRWWIEEGMNENIVWAIKNLEIPTYVIHGRKDEVIKLEDVEEEVLPNTYHPKLIVFGRTGHLVPLESPRKLARIIKKIVKTQ